MASVAHAEMLAECGIISTTDSAAIVAGLHRIEAEITEGKFPWREDLEDIHMNVEARLYDLIGEPAGRLHTARSRNDQTATATRLFTMRSAVQAQRLLRVLQHALLDIVERDGSSVLPGYTHLQRAQPVLLGHHMLAYFEMFSRDAERFQQAYTGADSMPLGSGALAGVPYPIDRAFTARQLGFSRIAANPMDAVSDRDYIAVFASTAALCQVHLSRLAEDLIIWSSDEFGFVRLGENVTTGSSIMPQKRNPDFAELIRGKTGRVVGAVVTMLTALKGLPLTYNRDLQEDKQPLFEAVDTVQASLAAIVSIMREAQFNATTMEQAVLNSSVLATAFADYLVAKGMPFREAYAVVAGLDKTAKERDLSITALPLATLQEASPLFTSDVQNISPLTSVTARNMGPAVLRRQLQEAYGRLHKAL